MWGENLRIGQGVQPRHGHAVGRRAERARERAQTAFILSHFLPKATASHQNAGLGLSPTSWLLGPGKLHPLSRIVSSCVKWETLPALQGCCAVFHYVFQDSVVNAATQRSLY